MCNRSESKFILNVSSIKSQYCKMHTHHINSAYSAKKLLSVDNCVVNGKVRWTLAKTLKIIIIHASHSIPDNILTFRILMLYKSYTSSPPAIYFQPHVFLESCLLYVRHQADATGLRGAVSLVYYCWGPSIKYSSTFIKHHHNYKSHWFIVRKPTGFHWHTG